MKLRSTALIILVTVACLCSACHRKPKPAIIAPPPPPPIVNDTKSHTYGLYLPMVKAERIIFHKATLRLLDSETSQKEVLQTLIASKMGDRTLLPEGVKVLSFKVGRKGRAQIDFSKEIRSFYGGSDEESAVINSIVLTAAQFDKVKSVKFTCEGKPLETLGGHADLTVAVKPDYSMVEK